MVAMVQWDKDFNSKPIGPMDSPIWVDLLAVDPLLKIHANFLLKQVGRLVFDSTALQTFKVMFLLTFTSRCQDRSRLMWYEKAWSGSLLPTNLCLLGVSTVKKRAIWRDYVLTSNGTWREFSSGRSWNG